MRVGQQALARLDACPDPVYHGEVVKLAPMAIPQPGAPDIRIFEMLGTLREEDGRLRPGMSVEVGVVALPEVLSIPLGAVSAREGRSVVHCRRGAPSFRSTWSWASAIPRLRWSPPGSGRVTLSP